MAPLQLQPRNTTAGPIQDASQPFSIKTPPKTDIWRPNATEEVFTAPSFTTTLRLSTFKSLSVTVHANWKTLYDQGGLLIQLGSSSWIKTGIEFFDGKPALSVVGTDRYSDWSLAPLHPDDLAKGSATFQAVRDGSTMWVYALRDGGERQALREIKWAFVDGQDDDGEESMRVGVCAAKPTPDADDAGNHLEVFFKDFKLETA